MSLQFKRLKPMLKRLVSLIGFISPWQKERASESLCRSMPLCFRVRS
jgi:hypothetical protein